MQVSLSSFYFSQKSYVILVSIFCQILVRSYIVVFWLIILKYFLLERPVSLHSVAANSTDLSSTLVK